MFSHISLLRATSAPRDRSPILEELNHLGDSDARQAWKLPHNTLNAIHLRSIQRMYGESGNQILEYLCKNPGVAIPVVHGRLVQKFNELCGVRSDMGACPAAFSHHTPRHDWRCGAWVPFSL